MCGRSFSWVRDYAPWVRRIFIATDSRLPGRLMADHPKITVVRSAEHFSDADYLAECGAEHPLMFLHIDVTASFGHPPASLLDAQSMFRRSPMRVSDTTRRQCLRR
jgi:hypothetical protein